MKYYQEISCPQCNGTDLGKVGKSVKRVQRYFCIDRATNASGIRDTARVLGINKNTVISQLKKKKNSLVQVNPNFQQLNDAG
jgi:transposase-like protein